MNLRRIILRQLNEGAIYASTHYELARQLDIDPTRETATAATGAILDGMLSQGFVSHELEPDDYNYDPRFGSQKQVMAYRLTDKGKAHLQELLESSSA